MTVIREWFGHRRAYGVPAWAFALFWFMILLYLFLFGHTSLTRTRQFSPDSMNYVDVARNLSSGRGLTQNTVGFNQPYLMSLGEGPTPFTIQAPLFPIAIAGLNRLGISCTDAALLIPALCYGLVIWLAFRLTLRISGPAAGLLLAGMLTYYPAMTFVCRHAWNESLGVSFLLLAFLLILKSEQDGRRLSRVFLAGLVAGLALGVRYAMLPAVAAGALFYLVRPGSRDVRLSRALVLAFGFAIPASLVLGHAYLAGGGLPAPKNPPDIGWWDHARAGWLTLSGEYLANRDQAMQRWLLLALVAGSAAWLGAQRRLQSFGRDVLRKPGAILLGLWVVAYCLLIVFQKSTYDDPMDARYMFPAGVALVILGTACLTEVTRVRVGTALVLSVLLIGSRVGEEISKTQRTPPYSQERAIASSARLSWIREHTTPDDLIIGDDTVDLPFYLDRDRAVSFSPYPISDYMTYTNVMKLAEKHGRGGSGVYLVLHDWGPQDTWRRLFGDFVTDLVLNRLEAYPGITLRERVADGYVFQIRGPRVPPG